MNILLSNMYTLNTHKHKWAAYIHAYTQYCAHTQTYTRECAVCIHNEEIQINVSLIYTTYILTIQHIAYIHHIYTYNATYRLYTPYTYLQFNISLIHAHMHTWIHGQLMMENMKKTSWSLMNNTSNTVSLKIFFSLVCNSVCLKSLLIIL